MSAQTNRFTRAAKMAKKLYKTGRYKRYSDAVSAAFKKIGSGKRKPAAKKVRKVKKIRHSKKAHRVARSSSVTGVTVVGSISQHKAHIRKLLQEKLKMLLYKRETAVTKSWRNYYSKLIRSTKAHIKQYSD